MRNIWVIAEREYKHYFISPIAYIFAFAILLFLGVLFFANMLAAFSQQYAPPDISIVVGPLVTVLLFTTPAITMRTVAEEQKNGTLEILLTAPVRDWELVVGKWLAAVLFLLTLLLVTWFFPILMNGLIKPGIDQGLMAASYLGLILLSMAWLAIGVMMSSFFSNQIAAFIATWIVFIVLWVLSIPVQASGSAGGDVIRYLDMSQHINEFMRGVIEVKDVVYYLSVTALALFLGSASVEMRRWK
jgi:ABC-2 type transport system permease protein